ncbi:MAG: GDP-mannose-dependent alpha-mannosyltransferase MgtA [Candidatus Berkelbacteria bacterium Licking1014_2]|uniref:GDP-mannose-dependent alpha-mannosyltransferase MgtA n=1 Tax=Candidatus Berkelbacteria bacterium Licking1014_2 TaxID=2017146 RepID=A0A554LVZ1_9BACT|nr:MAG: GDP-mannose-dependent alpha-mannosyltransferase MgtA [Candidatus Berkelbacteria bacterium Licking1014_2]
MYNRKVKSKNEKVKSKKVKGQGLNIIIVSQCFKPTRNGVVDSIDTNRTELEKMGHRVFVFAPRSHDKDFRETDDRVFRLPSFVALFSRKDYPIIVPWAKLDWQMLGNFQPDIVHTQHIFTAGRLAQKISRTLGIPLVATYHTLIADYAQQWLPVFGRQLKKGIIWRSRQFCNSADRIVAPSTALKDVLISYGVTKPITVIPTGIYLEKYHRLDPRPLKAKFNIPDSRKLILFVGRLAIEKNVDLLVETFRRLGRLNFSLPAIFSPFRRSPKPRVLLSPKPWLAAAFRWQWQKWVR